MPQADELSITFAPFWGIFKGMEAYFPSIGGCAWRERAPSLEGNPCYQGSRSVGKSMTSRIVSRPVRSIASRSIPNPSPPVGGIP